MAFSVVEHFDVVEDNCSELGTSLKPGISMDPSQLLFHGRPEPFHRGVIETVTNRSERGGDLEIGEPVCEHHRRVLGGFNWSLQHFDRGGVGWAGLLGG